MMEMLRIEVITYSGYRGEERPTAFILRGKRIEVMEILDKRIEETFADRKQKRLFKIKGSDGYTHLLCYDEQTSEWSYGQ
jgi:hypothetical protein